MTGNYDVEQDLHFFKDLDFQTQLHRIEMNKYLHHDKIEYIDEPGILYDAEVHSSCHRMFKVKKLDKYVKFCKDCQLPSETVGSVERFTCCDSKKQMGLGVHLYFFYIKCLMVIALITIILAAIPSLIWCIEYSDELEKHCTKYYAKQANFTKEGKNQYLITNNSRCEQYLLDEKEHIINNTLGNWLTRLSIDTLDSYGDIFEEYGNKETFESLLIEFSLIYLITGIVILIVNFFMVHKVHLLDDIDNFSKTTSSDYAVFMEGLPKSNINTSGKDIVIKEINEVSKGYYPFEVYDIVPCLDIYDYYRLTNDILMANTQIYHVEKLRKQINKNRDRGYSRKTRNLAYISHICCSYYREKPIADIHREKIRKTQELKCLLNDIYLNPHKYDNGLYVVIFEKMIMRDKFYDFFPSSFLHRFVLYIKYFFVHILFCSCYSDEESKRVLALRLRYSVHSCPNPEEIIWENLGLSCCRKFLYICFSVVVMLGMLVVVIGIVLGLTEFQHYIVNTEGLGESFWKYFISFVIAMIITTADEIGKKILKKVTEVERPESKTSFLIRHSLKVTIFSFFLIALVPLLVNYLISLIHDEDCDLVNNLFMIFIVNSLIPPLIFYFNSDFISKFMKRIYINSNLQGVEREDSLFTRKELNAAFEKQDFNVVNKYSYVTVYILMALFYIAIFPIGSFLSLFALLLTYILEVFYLGHYQRPVVASAKLCLVFIENLKWVCFVMALGTYIFYSWVMDEADNKWTIINIVVFFVIALIPYNNIRINFLNITEGQTKTSTYTDNSILFALDCVKENPLTMKPALNIYFQHLKSYGYISEYHYYKLMHGLSRKSSMLIYILNQHRQKHLMAAFDVRDQIIKERLRMKILINKRNKEKKEEEDKMKKKGIITEENDYLKEILEERNNLIHYKLPENIIKKKKQILAESSEESEDNKKLLERSNALLFTRRVTFANMFYEFPPATEFNPWGEYWIRDTNGIEQLQGEDIKRKSRKISDYYRKFNKEDKSNNQFSYAFSDSNQKKGALKYSLNY